MTPHRSISLAFVIILVSLTITGCVSSTGQRVETDKVSQIKKGVTTRAEVEALLGQPTNVTVVGNGKRMMFYQYWEARAKGESFIPYAGMFVGGTNNRQQMLQIMLDENNVVEDYEFNDRATETTGGVVNRQEVPKK